MSATAKLEDRHIERLWRQIRAKDTPQTVVRETSPRRFFLIDAQSPRVDALLNCPEWSRRVVGTFYPDVEIDVLCEEVG